MSSNPRLGNHGAACITSGAPNPFVNECSALIVPLSSLQRSVEPGWLGTLVISVPDGAVLQSSGCFTNADRLAQLIISMFQRVGRLIQYERGHNSERPPFRRVTSASKAMPGTCAIFAIFFAYPI
ncbi:unnamed protein product [Protopolystoma xenopodis]|uniref:Uncharacterized protein n=1 Tax=Protopolystoma xenopodis TaxID=117903 RepID=A0A448XRY5_9PLAT|nr:unnamed protein product [Protopolystoma xenopodis]